MASTGSGDRLRSEFEERWVSYQPYLLSKGYRLRARYQPDWVPSWEGKNVVAFNCEDSVDSMPVRVLDATRINDNRQVIIKLVAPSGKGREGIEELELLRHFSSPPLGDDPSNHVVPCLDTFPIPDTDGNFVIMPLLGPYSYPPFFNLAEVHEFLRQIFEGLLFMHRNNVAHCDIASANIMMDTRTLYTEPFHPFHQRFALDIKRRIYPQYIRSQVSMRYYFIDLGYAKWLKESDAPRTIPADRARLMAPEQVLGNLYDPFLGDIFQLGAVIRRDLLKSVDGLEFLRPLALEMTQREPHKRPPLQKARTSMDTAFLGLNGWRYRWPLAPKGANFQARLHLYLVGIMAELSYWMEKLVGLLRQ
ncbi:kinase domain protein [Rhizoctonia solani AG-3 Rhs1AP]|uniref:Kinase domain protein n=2 Tax=Rhizoctonia solani AG-3 TaxID=1086053 RepID=A0A074RVT1_9AGAM|nr:kinase domain protein [Rhizoctonia solani AG-3 Rhs1AP]KEP49420.1 kinase domain protein [Rhizoctonia solani 123E]